MSHVPCPCIQAERAEAKAGMWRGASPASEADRVQATQRAWQCTYSVHMRGGQRCSAPDDLDDLPCFTSRRCSASSTISTCQTGCATASPRSASPCSAPISSPRRCSNGTRGRTARGGVPRFEFAYDSSPTYVPDDRLPFVAFEDFVVLEDVRLYGTTFMYFAALPKF